MGRIKPPLISEDEMANATATSICNSALFHLKQERRITDYATDQTSFAKLLRQLFPDTIDALVEMHPWNFATVRATLALSAEAPVYEFSNKFQLPTNPYCLIVKEVVDSQGVEPTDWIVAGRFIETDSAGLKIKYLKRISDYTELSPLFIKALEHLLALELAEPLTRSGEIAEQMEKKFKFYFNKAKRADSLQGTYSRETDNDYSWLAVR